MTSRGSTAPSLSTTQRLVLVLLAASAGAMPSLQPLLLAGLLDQHRIVAAEIGRAAAAEALGMAASFALASTFHRSRSLVPLVSGALLMMGGANIVTGFASGLSVIALRAIAGLGGGILLWVLIRLITREPDPARAFAIYASVQAAWGFALSLLLSHLLIPYFGPAGAYLALAAFNLAMLSAVGLLPQFEHEDASPGRRLPPLAGVIALVGVGLFLCGIMAFWSYAVPLFRQMSRSGIAMELAIPLLISVHVMGGMTAAATSRCPPLLACVGGPILMIACLGATLMVDSVGLQHVLLLVFAFVWMFVPPFQLPLLLRIDPTTRTAMYISSSHLAGIAAGPFLASLAVKADSVAGVAAVAMACLAGAATLPLIAGRLPVQRPA